MQIYFSSVDFIQVLKTKKSLLFPLFHWITSDLLSKIFIMCAKRENTQFASVYCADLTMCDLVHVW